MTKEGTVAGIGYLSMQVGGDYWSFSLYYKTQDWLQNVTLELLSYTSRLQRGNAVRINLYGAN